MDRNNNIFGFNATSERQDWITSREGQPEKDNMIIGDPLSTNFVGNDYMDMSGWKTFWQSTFAPKKYKENRLNEARGSVDKKYPTDGSCSVLTDRLDKLNNEISSNVYKTGGGRGSRRVSDRQVTALKERREEVTDAKKEECKVDPAVQLQMQQQFEAEQKAKRRKQNIIVFSVVGVVLIGVGITAYYMLKGGKSKTRTKSKRKK